MCIFYLVTDLRVKSLQLADDWINSTSLWIFVVRRKPIDVFRINDRHCFYTNYTTLEYNIVIYDNVHITVLLLQNIFNGIVLF